MNMHEFARRLGAAEGKDPLFEALQTLRQHASPILERPTTGHPRNPRGWSTWSDPGMPDSGSASRELVAQDPQGEAE